MLLVIIGAIGGIVLIPTTATARVRELSRGGRRKNDRIDAAAAASVAALQGDARQVYPETTTDSLALLDERRVNLSHSRTRTVKQLHALLRELMAGGAPTSLTPVSATSAVRGLRPRTGPDRIRVELAKELIADVRRFDEQLAANAAKITVLLEEHGTRLRKIDGIGPILAARLLGRTGPPEQVRLGRGVCELHRHRARPNRERRFLPPPALPLRRPATELRDLHHRHDPNPHARQHRPRLLRQENRRRQNTAIRHPRA